ncbi:calcium incorporation protein MxaA [Piscinibacter sp. XHJ-5]|uniref:calcium incorporation protein MxaA n=1 Tax=Piscinibacter sp. XHJ-5 TaxID=3037797 RepID=UPI002452D2D1|nr:calcium incorporation protein MxaA [Piscinibacter sp. XHJ-5]
MTARRCLATLLLALAAGAAPAATVEQPRPFGHVIGDVLTQRVLLHDDGHEVTATAPPAGRVGPWLERRPARVERDSAGRRWLVLDYQVINAPRDVSVVSLPALTIATQAGAPLSLPAWPVSIGPLTRPGALDPMRPDRPPAPRPTETLERQLALAIGALAFVLLAWLGWWAARQWRDARALPFARAWRALRRLDPAGGEAWLVLHRAIDASAGRVVQSATLSRLFVDAPQLAALRTRIEDFYRRSDQRFFADERAGPPYPLLDLCRALREVEKRHHG